ncbi:MAG: hypothetical protein A2063_02830 [Gallionellales bacterium GWA2_60_142]|nr:MAG: hypothetical protein A2063_02830 [Gallionellales bacterium GWA2_60_142]HCI13143.1 hypothetical protein [Gallionellaceae bacterium]
MGEDFLYFKFKPINKYLIDSLVTPSLYFPKPDLLNDPFDCQLDVRKAFARAAEVVQGKRKNAFQAALKSNDIFENYSKQFQNLGVCSFSLLANSFDEPLLWSHYADAHKGVSLLYRFTEAYLNNPKEILGVDTVKYDPNILTNWLINSPFQPDDSKFVEELTKVFLTAKSDAWQHEKEARIIRTTNGTLNIPHGCLEQICFGLRTPQPDIELVSKLAREYSGCTKFCKIVHADTDFGITAIEL